MIDPQEQENKDEMKLRHLLKYWSQAPDGNLKSTVDFFFSLDQWFSNKPTQQLYVRQLYVLGCNPYLSGDASKLEFLELACLWGMGLLPFSLCHRVFIPLHTGLNS